MPLIFLLVFLFSIAIAPAAFALDGNGEENDPYLITSQKDLEDFRSIVNNGTKTGAHAKLTANITLTGSWTPIGDESNRYTGTFDGNGYTIEELSINSASSGNCGLFGYIGTGGKVMNLTLEDVEINVSSDIIIYAGAVAGSSEGGTIEGCTVTGSSSIYGKTTDIDAFVGGIAGYVLSTSIKNCVNSAEVYGEADDSAFVGGIAGYVYSDSSLTNCGYLKNASVNAGRNAAGYDLGSQTTNVGTFSDKDELNNIVFKLTPLIGGEEFVDNTTYSMAAGGTMEISFKAWPGNFDYVYSNDYVDIQYSGDNLVSLGKNGGTITVTGLGSEGNSTITVTTKLYTYKFSTSDGNGSYDDSVLESKDYTVKVELVNYVPITGISLDKSYLTMNPGETQELTVTYTPDNATNQTVTWKSSDTDVATVDQNGKVTGVSVGSATITATATENEDISAPCTVTVNPILVESVEISAENDYEKLETDKEYIFTVTTAFTPENATDQSVEWSVGGTSIYTWWENGDGTLTITTNTEEGYVTITATASDKYNEGVKVTSDPLTYNVIIPNVESVTITPDSATISNGVGDTATLTAKVSPSNAKYDAIEWESEDESIATVEAGEGNTATVTATGAGRVTITATAGGVTGECEITVDEVPATGVTINGGTAIELEKGETATITATLEPSNSTDKITWTSSDYEIVYVDEDGKITAVSPGAAIITATTTSGETASVTIRVTEAETEAPETPGEEETDDGDDNDSGSTESGGASGGSSGGGGCNAGTGALALLALIPLALRRRR